MAIINGRNIMLAGLRGPKGEKGEPGDIASQKKLDEIDREIASLYVLSGERVTGTEELTEAYTTRQTANGLSGLIDGALTRVECIQGATLKDSENQVLNHANINSIVSKNADGTMESICQLPKTITLYEWDKVLPKKGKIVRQTARIVLTGDEAWASGSNQAQLKNIIPHKAGVYADTPRYMALCNILSYSPDNNGTCWYIFVSGGVTILGFTRKFLGSIGVATPNADGTDYTFTSANLPDWKAWLKAKYEAGHPVEIIYRVIDEYATEEDIDLPTTSYKAWSGGTETVIQGEESPVNVTITQIYAVTRGGAEE